MKSNKAACGDLPGERTNVLNPVRRFLAEKVLHDLTKHRWYVCSITVIVLCIIAVYMPIPLLAQANPPATPIVQNGDFEAGADGSWQYTVGNLPPARQELINSEFPTSGEARSGEFAAVIGSYGIEGFIGITQEITLPEASQYILSYHYRLYSEAGACIETYAYLFLESEAGREIIASHSICTTDEVANWLPHEVDITPFVDAGKPYTINFELHSTSESFIIFYLDDIAIDTDNDAPPTPFNTGNLIANGSFETLSDWTFYKNEVEVTDIVVLDFGTHSGNHMLKMPVLDGSPSTPNNYAIVQENVTLPAERDVTLLLNYLLEEDTFSGCNSYYGVSILIGIQPLGSEQEVQLEAIRDCGPNEPNWHLAKVDLNKYRGQTVRLSIHVQNVIPYHRSRTLYIDDISLDLEHNPITLTPSDLLARRFAAEFLTSVQNDALLEEWKTATLDTTSRPLYRPGVPGVAFYEFQVLSDTVPMGYIIAATGEHDLPIVSWDREGLAPTYGLDALSYSVDLFGKNKAYLPVANYYIFDTLRLAAENRWGKLLTPMGQLPLKAVGFPTDWLERDFATGGSGQVVTVSTTGGITEVLGVETLSTDEVADFELSVEPWDDWEELKSNYHLYYAHLLRERKQTAAEEWEQINLFGRMGLICMLAFPIRLLCCTTASPLLHFRGPAVTAPILLPNYRKRQVNCPGLC